MITCELIGRMGNQCFTIAATIAEALHGGQEYHIPMHTRNNSVWPPHFTWLTNPAYNAQKLLIHRNEDGHGYSPIFGSDKLDSRRNYLVKGYRQSYKYFNDFVPEIKKLLRLDAPTLDNTLAIHVRRGDYLTLPNHHPVCTPDYYMEAQLKMYELLNMRPFDRIIVFSDDIDWCKGFFNHKSVEFSEGRTELEDMRLMASCQYQIIANSSFSLFAALMNTHPDKVIISPHEDNWFGSANKHLDVSDLLPDSFIKIRY